MINNIKEILEGNLENADVFFELTNQVMDKGIEEGFDSLSENEKYLFMVLKMLMEVNNGGFHQYFLNTDGVYSKDTLHFLNLIKETNFSNLLNKAINIFEAEVTEDEKNDKFNELDSEFYELNEDKYESLYNRCVDYIKDSLKNS
jgi:hypothetical protein